MYSEYLVLDNDEFEPKVYEVGCAMPDLRYALGLALGVALGVALIGAAAGVWLLNRMRPW